MNFLFTKTPLMFFVQDFWRDEAFSYFMAKKSFLEIIPLSIQDFSPPLYHFLLKIWMAIFGSSEVALRSLSLFFFVGLLFVAFHFFLDVFRYSHTKSLFGMLLFLINPLLLYYAFEARSYSMFAFFVTLSFYAFILKKKKLYLFSTIAGLYTHYFMIFALIIQIVFLRLQKKKESKEELRWTYISALTFLPWFILAIFEKVTTSTQFWIDKVKISDLWYLPAVMYTGFEKNFGFPGANRFGYPFYLLIISFILTAVVVIAYRKLGKKGGQAEKSLFILLLLWAAAPALFIFFLSFIKPLYLPRYLILCAPGMTFLFVYSLRFIKNPAKSILLLMMVGLTLYYNTQQIALRKKSNIAKTLKEINALAHQNDVVYVTNELDYFVAGYYATQHKVYLYGKKYQNIPDYVGKALIPQDRVRSLLPSYPVRAFIYKGYGYEIQTLY